MKIIDGKIVDHLYEEFNSLESLNENLASASVRGLAKKKFKEMVWDYSLNMSMSGGKLLALSLALKDYIEENFKGEDRIGVALPSCLPGLAVNIALQMAGKTSVNINFTMGERSAQSCLKRAGIKSVIGSKKVRQKVCERAPNFPWTDNFRDIADILKSIGKKRIVKKFLLVALLPSWAIIKFFKIPVEGGNKEASIIFTSGSEGEPKAAVLTHRNLISNARQMWEIRIIDETSTLHGNLPLFHSFGQTIQVWFTSIYGVRQVTVQSPLEINPNLEAMREGRSTVIISTPTFLRSYYKKGVPEDFKHMKSVIGGAEKTPEGFIEMWEKKFPNTRYLEGYGLTEAAPVVGVNLPEGLPTSQFRPEPSGTRKHSIGQIFGGTCASVADVNTGEFLPIGQTGILCLKSPSIFAGYLGQPELSKEKLIDGWLHTGDLAILDKDGYVYIKGRLSRFSKIGGEMVPHSSLEDLIIKVLALEESEVPLIAVGSTIDENKGEALVILSAIDIDMHHLRKKLAEEKIPNLWIPRHLVKIEKIPVLGSGKLDLASIHRACQQGA